MSEITSRPSLRSVAAANCIAAIGTGQAILAGHVLQSLVAQVDPPLARQWADGVAAPREHVLSVPAALGQQLTAERDALTASVGKLAPLTALKLSVLSGIDAAGYVGKPSDIATPLRALANAADVTAAEHARAELFRTLQASHLDALLTTVARACTESSRSLAFNTVTIDATPDGLTRIVATDAAGRALVSEISVTGRDVQVETEVVGVRDGSCTSLLDRYDAEMAAHGVQGDRTRRTTGGICQLNAARRMLNRLVKPKIEGAPPKSGDGGERRRRLNAKPTAANRQRG